MKDEKRAVLGILGAGQLGKMLALAAANWDLDLWLMDKEDNFPGANFASKFVEGDFKNYDDVYHFGKQVDVLSIEIEHVNTEALLQLKKEGLTIHPDPESLNVIKDKGIQKQFYKERDLPTSEFEFYENGEAITEAINSGILNLPFVQKSREAGYDGRGVAVINDQADLDLIMDCPCIIEPKVSIDKELAVIAARNENGEIKTFPAVEMAFNPVANLVEYLFCPANITKEVENRVQDLAHQVISAYGLCGLLAVEFFLTKSGEVLINEVAPRTHNSGHHTIDSAVTSQFEQQIRAVMNFPLGETMSTIPAVMVNLLGQPDYTGPAIYKGFEKCLSIPGVKFHLYGKKITKPFRKMGHATIVDPHLDKAKEKAIFIKENLKIIS